jgi:purine-binding chemotaxis protein CheW
LAAAAVRGLINLRGQIVTAVDLRCRLGMPLRNREERPMNVVVRDGEHAVSLLVDRIGDVLELEDDLFETPPSTVKANVRELILGAYKLPRQLLLVLDTARAVSECEPCGISSELPVNYPAPDRDLTSIFQHSKLSEVRRFE